MRQGKQLPSLSGRSESRHSSSTRIRQTPIHLGNRYNNLQFLKATVEEIGSGARPARNQLLSAICKKVKSKYDALYTQYNENRKEIDTQIRGLQSQRGLQAEVEFIKRQSQLQKKKYNDLVYKLKQKEQELGKLKLKDKEIKALQIQNDNLLQKFKGLINQQKSLEEQFSFVDYEKAVIEDMVETRRSQVEYSRDLLVQRYQTLSAWLQKLGSGQVKTVQLQKRKVLLDNLKRQANDQAFGEFQIQKINDQFKTILQHQLQQYLGKTAIRQIIVHQKEIQSHNQRIEKELKQKKIQELRELREQQALRLQEQKRSIEFKLLNHEESYSGVRRETAVMNIQNFLPTNFNQHQNKQILNQVKQKLLSMRDELTSKIANVGSTLDARNVQMVSKANVKQLQALSKEQLKLKVKQGRVGSIIERCCLLTTRLAGFVQDMQEIKRDSIGGHIGRVSLLLQKKRIGKGQL